MDEKWLSGKGVDVETAILAGNIGTVISNLLGEDVWQGDNPYTVKTIDPIEEKAYILEIRRGNREQSEGEWVTISQRVSDIPGLVRVFQLDKLDGKWTYNDGYLAKYGEPSTDLLKTLHDRLLRSTQSPSDSGIRES